MLYRCIVISLLLCICSQKANKIFRRKFFIFIKYTFTLYRWMSFWFYNVSMFVRNTSNNQQIKKKKYSLTDMYTYTMKHYTCFTAYFLMFVIGKKLLILQSVSFYASSSTLRLYTLHYYYYIQNTFNHQPKSS